MSNNAGNVGEVEEILDKEGSGRKVKYLIKWKGYDSSWNEWVPIKRCRCPDSIREFEEKRAVEEKGENKAMPSKKNKKNKKKKKNWTPARDAASPPSDDKSSTGTPPQPPVYVDELDFKITDVKGLFNDNGHIVAVVTSDKDNDHHLVDVKAVAIQNLEKLIEGLNNSCIGR